MKRFILTLFAALYALAQNAETPRAALSGVVASRDGQPLPGAKVTLSADPSFYLQGALPASVNKSATADASGK